jgi:exodeoxyribonuclease VII large subunit
VDKLPLVTDVTQFNEESISVSQLNKLAKALLENNIPIFWIKGEVSGFNVYNHAYFDLKDGSSKVACILYANIIKQLDFAIENGQQIEVRGKVTIYPPNGSYQINIDRVRQTGMGELWEAYQRLLKKLENEGLFAAQHKKPLPVFPQRIGVITSKEGAVIRDVIITLKRRMPNIQIIVYHTLVQGADAGMQVAQAIKKANTRNEVDVLIVCRGGGSMQDLWCFNEEVVVREAYMSHIPLISAIGHETDTTLLDYVADLRAPTPTAAAELVAKSRNEWLNTLNRLKLQLNNKFEKLQNDKKQLLDLYFSKLKLLSPNNLIKSKKEAILQHKAQLFRALQQLIYKKNKDLELFSSRLMLLSPKNKINTFTANIENLEQKLINNINLIVKNKKQHLLHLSKQLNAVNPEQILARGYAIIKNDQGKIVYSANDVQHQQALTITLSKGQIHAIVDKKGKLKQDELL